MDSSELFGDDGARLISEAGDVAAETRERQQAFMDALRDSGGDDAMTVETELLPDFPITVSTRLDGDIIDRLGAIDKKLESVEDEDARAYVISDAARDAASILSDVIVDDEYSMSLFMNVYKQQGLEALGEFLQTVFTAVRDAQEERHEVAESFRSPQ